MHDGHLSRLFFRDFHRWWCENPEATGVSTKLGSFKSSRYNSFFEIRKVESYCTKLFKVGKVGSGGRRSQSTLTIFDRCVVSKHPTKHVSCNLIAETDLNGSHLHVHMLVVELLAVMKQCETSEINHLKESTRV